MLRSPFFNCLSTQKNVASQPNDTNPLLPASLFFKNRPIIFPKDRVVQCDFFIFILRRCALSTFHVCTCLFLLKDKKSAPRGSRGMLF